MYQYITRKLIATIITTIVVMFVVYVSYVSFVGNPLTEPIKAEDWPAYEAKLALYHINEPVIVRFWYWFSGLFKGDIGPIYNLKDLSHQNVFDFIFKPMKNTMQFVIPSFFAGMFIGLGLGFWAGYKRGKLTDTIINAFVTFFIAIPSFVFAVLLLILGPKIGLFTTYMNPSDPSVTLSMTLNSLVLPVLMSSLLSLISWTYMARIQVSEILESDYILSARTRGLGEFQIFKKYVLRNSMYPFIGSLVTSFMIVFSGSLIIEKFFGINGSSWSLLQANKTGEINLMMFNLLFFTGIGLFTQVLSEIATFSINPIIKSQFAAKSTPFRKLSSLMQRRKERKAATAS